ncbi:MAG: hypothetical protein J0H17_12930, partial [Rhizobiales bacterium]|nr:hypothetical protein [Hyphomicrobiales bacterium]
MLARLIHSAFSVRSRIALLALIPVVAFIANGVTYTAGERDISDAFGNVRRVGALADASQLLKSNISEM